MMCRLIAALIMTLAVASQCQADEVEVLLTTATRTLRELDPLYVRIDLLNRSEDDVIIDPLMGSSYGTVQFEVRRDGEWSDLPLLGQGLKSPEVREPRDIPPAQKFAAFELLFRSGDGKFIFHDPGRVELRAKVMVGRKSGPHRRAVFSPPVAIDVQDRFDPHVKSIISSADLLLDVVQMPGVNERAPVEDLRVLAQQLQRSVLRTSIEIGLHLCTLGTTRSVEARASAVAAIQNARQQMGEVMSEAIGIVLAHELMQLHAWDDLKQVLNSLRQPTDVRETLTLQYHLMTETGSGMRRGK
jgi:hypothetical protein